MLGMSISCPVIGAVARSVVRSISQPGRGGSAVEITPPPEALPGVGEVQMQGGQSFMSIIPNNPFSPESFGWELYGDEP